MNFPQGHPGTKVRYVSFVLVFLRKNARIHKNGRNSWTFRFGPFFGLVCRGDAGFRLQTAIFEIICKWGFSGLSWWVGVLMGWADGWPHPQMGGATHRDPWDKQGKLFFGGGGEWANNAHEPIVEAHRVGGHQNPSHSDGLCSCTGDSTLNLRRGRTSSGNYTWHP